MSWASTSGRGWHNREWDSDTPRLPYVASWLFVGRAWHFAASSWHPCCVLEDLKNWDFFGLVERRIVRQRRYSHWPEVLVLSGIEGWIFPLSYIYSGHIWEPPGTSRGRFVWAVHTCVRIWKWKLKTGVLLKYKDNSIKENCFG